MFIQVITSKTGKAAEVKAHGEKATVDNRPEGFLGVTAGVADDGTYIAVVRFESQAAAEANSGRPEQDEWFKGLVALLDGEPAFYNCPDVITMRGGGSDSAGFVQVMVYKPKDLAPIRAMSDEFEKYADLRPDLIGATTAFATDGTVIDTNYFTSEADARAGEAKEMPAELQEMMAGFEANVGEVTFIDLKDPWLY